MVNESQGVNSRGAEATSSGLSYPSEGSGSRKRYDQAQARIEPIARPADRWTYRILKRWFDLLLVLLAVPVLLPAMLLVASVVCLTSPGPVFFSHRRISFQGNFFSMWKFRTMSVDSAERLEHYLSRRPEARAEWNLTHKLREDPRVTPVGLFLRRYSLDELPQVWNVITGQMSLVGPRPIVAAEVEKYGACFEHYCRVKPGVTGLWQVSGRSKLTYPERVKLDRDYVEQWSMAGDVKVLLRTARSVVNQDGAF